MPNLVRWLARRIFRQTFVAIVINYGLIPVWISMSTSVPSDQVKLSGPTCFPPIHWSTWPLWTKNDISSPEWIDAKWDLDPKFRGLDQSKMDENYDYISKVTSGDNWSSQRWNWMLEKNQPSAEVSQTTKSIIENSMSKLWEHVEPRLNRRRNLPPHSTRVLARERTGSIELRPTRGLWTPATPTYSLAQNFIHK